MNQVLDGIDKVVTAISGVLYMPWVPFLLLAAGLFFTFRSKFMQVRLLGESFRVVSEKPKTKGGISSFGALMVSTASRVGTGNIVGVSTAICMGGYGAVFWMWMTAILGGATSFIESTLAQVYKRKNPDGTYFGGPSYYMETALKKRWLGVIFAVIIILTYAVGYNMLASYNLQSSFSAFSFYHEGSTPLVIGIILALLFAVCVMGGAKRLTKITGALVPIMGIFYVAVAVVVVVGNASIVPEVFRNIFASAFDFPAIFGGFCRQGHHDTRPRLGRTKNPPCVIGQERITVEEALCLGIRDEFICRFMANPAEGGHDGIQIGNRPSFAASQGGQAQGQEGALDFPQVMAAQS